MFHRKLLVGLCAAATGVGYGANVASSYWSRLPPSSDSFKSNPIQLSNMDNCQQAARLTCSSFLETMDQLSLSSLFGIAQPESNLIQRQVDNKSNDQKQTCETDIQKPTYHYLAYPVLDKHVTVATLDKLAPNQCVPVMRSMVKMASEYQCSDIAHHMIYPFPEPTDGFAPPPKTVVQISMCPPLYQTSSKIRDVLSVHRDGTHVKYQPHITFNNKTEAKEFIEKYHTTGFLLDRMSLVNAKLKQEVFTVPLRQPSSFSSFSSPTTQTTKADKANTTTTTTTTTGNTTGWKFVHPDYETCITQANDWLFDAVNK